ncbi:FAD dependent oxidoreductase [Bombardia bombarda]|uniref:FAD dependent oxidoreductase n=1 Tax=Bombardia bombarda TaxID=252184 RepID=A0AA40BWE0_9PEZI|nr:FAD dependent oxidoreductase [Bombardia bombarda]
MGTPTPQKRNIVIVGGGIIGCTTAYFLTRHPKFDPSLHRITLLEATAIASGASGKAGGLLALWAHPACLVPLSYRLHRELAAEHGGAERWGYRQVGCGDLGAVVTDPASIKSKVAAAAVTSTAAVATDGKLEQKQQNGDHDEDDDKAWEKLPKQDAKASDLLQDSPLPAELDWIDGSLVRWYKQMGEDGSGYGSTETSQVHPFHFTTAIAALAREKGVDVRIGAKVTRINHSKTAVTSVEYEDRGEDLSSSSSEAKHVVIDDVTDVVVTAGPWTGRLLPRSKIEGLRAHSVVFEADVSPFAVFTNIQLPTSYVPEHRASKGQKRKHRGNVDPEIYARPFGEVYACGEPDTTTPLPETADLVQCDTDQCDDLVAYIGTVSPQLAAAPVKARQSCYLPRHMRFGKEYDPLIGQTGVPGLWVAAGHTCWGIQNGPGTGCLMAEMLLDGRASSADVERLEPGRFRV